MGKILKALIVFQLYTNTATEGYAETKEWCFLKETYADIVVKGGGTEYAEEGPMAFTRVEFMVRYDPKITYDTRIKYNNQIYTINHIEPRDVGGGPGKHWMKIISVNWEDDR